MFYLYSKRECSFRRARFLYLSVCGYVGVLICRFVRFVGLRVYSFVGLSVCGFVGVWGCGGAGLDQQIRKSLQRDRKDANRAPKTTQIEPKAPKWSHALLTMRFSRASLGRPGCQCACAEHICKKRRTKCTKMAGRLGEQISSAVASRLGGRVHRGRYAHLRRDR